MFGALLSRQRQVANVPKPGKRQSRADILDCLGGGVEKEGGSQLKSQLGHLGTRRTASSASVVHTSTSAKSSTALSLNEWLAKDHGEGGDTASTSNLGNDHVKKNASNSASSNAAVISSNGSGASVGCAAATDGSLTIDSSGASHANGDGAASTHEETAPVRITGEMDLAKGWRAMFRNAKDKWDVDEDGVKCNFWHSETGCCFEWDQTAATLCQLAEGSDSPADVPKRVPVWTAACPEKDEWIWDKIPLPPTDAAASKPLEEAGMDQPEGDSSLSVNGLQDSLNDSFGDICHTVHTSAGNSSSSCTNDGAADASMPPPAVTCKRRSASPSSSVSLMPPPSMIPLKRRNSDNSASPDKKNRPANGAMNGDPRSAAEISVEATETSQPSEQTLSSSFSSSSGLDPYGLGEVGCQPVGPQLPPTDMVTTTADEDDDDDYFGIAGSDGLGLADGDESSELPAAPTDRVKPQACDLDLDMFGNHEG